MRHEEATASTFQESIPFDKFQSDPQVRFGERKRLRGKRDGWNGEKEKNGRVGE